MNGSRFGINRPLLFLLEGSSFKLLIFHLALGFGSLMSPVFVILWFYAVVINYFSLSRSIQIKLLPMMLGYIIPIELIGRITHAHPFLPTEIGKYFGTFLLLYVFVIIGRVKRWMGVLLIFLSIPSIFIPTLTFDYLRYELVFNYLGFFMLALSVHYFITVRIAVEMILKIFRLIVLGSMSVLAYIIVRSPKITVTEFELTANESFTGGFGSNQVSTLLGLSFGLAALVILIRKGFFENSIKNIMIALAPLTWALLSFSRGGVLSPILALSAIILFELGRKRGRKKIMGKLLILIPVFIAIFYILNGLTGEKLLMRYKGETYATQSGLKEYDANTATSGRSQLVLSDILMWIDHPILGVGVGQSPKLRGNYGSSKGIAPHVEVTRLVAEHGIFGLFIAIIILFYPVPFLMDSKSGRLVQTIRIFCYVIAISATFHSAMRTSLTPLFYGLSFITVFPNENIR